VDALVLVCDSEDAAFTGEGYPFDAGRLGNSQTNSEPEWASCRRMQRTWVATVCSPSPIVKGPDASFGCRLSSI
jgi:hypothetical protein